MPIGPKAFFRLEEVKGAEQQAVIEMHLRPGLATQGSLWLMPSVSLMLSITLAFYLSSTTIVREIALGTWDKLRLAPNSSVLRLVLSKCMLPIVVALLCLALCSLVAAFLGLTLKPELTALAIAVYLPAVVGATMQGIAVSGLVRTETEAQFAAVAYLLGMLMFAGVLIPTDWSGPTVRALASVFPLMYAIEPAQAVILNAERVQYFQGEVVSLYFLSFVSFVFSLVIVYLRWKRL